MSGYLYTHYNAGNGNGSQVERTKVTGYLSLFLFIIFHGLNRIGFHHADLKGPSAIIRILRAISIDWNFLSIIHRCDSEGAHLIPTMLESIKRCSSFHTPLCNCFICYGFGPLIISNEFLGDKY